MVRAFCIPLGCVSGYDIVRIEISAIAELNVLAQMERPFGRVVVDIPGFSESRLRFGTAKFVAEQRIIDLQAGTQSLAICFVTAPKADRLSTLDPNQLTIVGGHFLEVLIQRANLHIPNALTKDVGGGAMSYRDHGDVLFDQSRDRVIVSLAFSRISNLSCSFNLSDNVIPFLPEAGYATREVEVIEVGRIRVVHAPAKHKEWLLAGSNILQECTRFFRRNFDLYTNF